MLTIEIGSKAQAVLGEQNILIVDQDGLLRGRAPAVLIYYRIGLKNSIRLVQTLKREIGGPVQASGLRTCMKNQGDHHCAEDQATESHPQFPWAGL